MFCWHRWSKWKTVETGKLAISYDEFTEQRFDPPIRVGVWVRQQRECEKCGKVQLRKVKS